MTQTLHIIGGGMAGSEAAWQAALLADLAFEAARLPGRRLASIFFGGGTPSLMKPETVAAILAEAPGATEIGDRAQAIRHAVAMLESGDTLIVAGKGHEEGQIVGTTVLPFSDHQQVRSALEETSL